MITAADALKKYGVPENGVALLYSPSACLFGDFSDVFSSESKNVFEWRYFLPDCELRWVRSGSSRAGIASFLKEVGEHDGGTLYQSLPGRYLLWGKGGKKENTLFEHRVGELKVPCAVPEGRRVCLGFKEYFSEDEYGNLTFFAERLTGLQEFRLCASLC
jgi:CRISPR-associated protein (TIGR03984 family)